MTEPGFTPQFQDCLRSPEMLLRSLWSKLRPGIPIIGMYHTFGDLKPPMAELDVADLRITPRADRCGIVYTRWLILHGPLYLSQKRL